MTNTEKVLSIVVVALVATLIITGVVLYQMSVVIHTTGQIKAIGVAVYNDANGTSPCTSIDWGILGPGDLKGVTVYIKNVKNTNATLNIVRNNTIPPTFAPNSTLAWNYSGQILAPAQQICTQITLLIDPNIKDIVAFSFDITIIATEPT
jgi:hypothetical protein